jgi:hypothetical protein
VLITGNARTTISSLASFASRHISHTLLTFTREKKNGARSNKLKIHMYISNKPEMRRRAKGDAITDWRRLGSEAGSEAAAESREAAESERKWKW